MKTGRLRLFPLHTVLFPGAVLNLHVFEERYRKMIAECLDTGEAFGVVLIRDGADAGDPDVTPHEVGTTAEIADVTPLPGGRYYLSTTGGQRFRIARIVDRDPFLVAEVSFIDDAAEDDDGEARASELTHRVKGEFREYAKLLVAFSGNADEMEIPADPVAASYAVGGALQVADALKQRLLELRTAEARLLAELGFLRRLLPQLRSLLERKKAQQKVVRDDAPGGEFRTHQEKFFGKHFSLN
jgi:Lon protease-like protein